MIHAGHFRGCGDHGQAKRDTFSHSDLQGALRDDDLSDGLRHGLETLHTLGTEPGREAIVSAMNARGVRLKELPPETSARELAMHLYMAQRGDASLADVFARAQTQFQDGGQSGRYHEYLGKESKTVTNLEKKKVALHAEVLRHCRESDLGEHVQVEAFEDDGTYVSPSEALHLNKRCAMVRRRGARVRHSRNRRRKYLPRIYSAETAARCWGWSASTRERCARRATDAGLSRSHRGYHGSAVAITKRWRYDRALCQAFCKKVD